MSRHLRRTCLAATLFLALGAASASAAVQWSITSVHGPTNMPPGGRGQYVLQAFNVGTTQTTAPYSVVDTLPAGVTVTDLAQSAGGKRVRRAIGDRHADRGEFTPLTANRARPCHARNLLKDVVGEKFRRSIGVSELR